jgi:bacillithiol system protein YtxJ
MKDWQTLTSISDLKNAIETSFQKPVLIFKHSTRCSISQMALDRFERTWTEANISKITPFYLDLIAHRDVSNQIADQLSVEHQSPQVLLIQDGKCIFSETHQSIRLQNSLDLIKNQNL